MPTKTTTTHEQKIKTINSHIALGDKRTSFPLGLISVATRFVVEAFEAQELSPGVAA